MAVPPQSHVAMNLVRNHYDSTFVAERGKTFERVTVPEYACRIMRIGQYQHAALVVSHGFQIVEVHRIRAVGILFQRIEHHLPAVALWRKAERMVHGRLDNDLLVGLDKHVNSHSDALYYARNEREPAGIHFPAVVRFNPVDDGRLVVRRFNGIAENRMFHTFL